MGKYIVTGDQYFTIDGIMLDIKQQLRTKHGSPLDPKIVSQELQKINKRKTFSDPVHKRNIFHGVVNYKLSLEAMIRGGHHNWTHPDITEKHFPIDHTRGTAKVDIQLIHFNRDIESDDAILELHRMDPLLCPATLPELLWFSKTHPEKQLKFPIVALGSVWQHLGDRGVACLCSGSDGRLLRLCWWSDGWRAHVRFAAVRKSAKGGQVMTL